MATTNTTVTEEEAQASRMSRLWKRLKKLTWRQLVVLVVILVLLIGGGYFAFKYHQAKNDVNRLSTNPQAAAQQQVTDTVNAVGKLVQLPANETPTLATVTDASKLVNQVFFAKAQNGDKVLIYTQAKVAVLYRPSINKVINIAPLTIGNGTTSGQ